MIWQDLVFSVGTAIFALSLVPTVRDNQKPSIMTSVPTAIILAVFSVTSMTMQLWLTAVLQVVSCILWTILAIQRHRIDKAK